VRGPSITIRCECGRAAQAHYGERWTCDGCGRTWSTSEIPPEEYRGLVREMRKYMLLAIGPPALAALVLVPLAVLVNLGYAFVLFVVVLAYGLLVLPKLRRRAVASMRSRSLRWTLHPE
jgi:hypothetical protein